MPDEFWLPVHGRVDAPVHEISPRRRLKLGIGVERLRVIVEAEHGHPAAAVCENGEEYISLWEHPDTS